ncbi:hypothetical protein CLCR_09154 [Cladophialophora carrionii]|uniref:Uncharacterized protein n=1 Tax=Cladophialophora carrionii TaxID=86049 RepID=A0A1C1CRN7_9EURO|nr:hypothetical protein CLCR_09154 [Cladophialophora carrionii]
MEEEPSAPSQQTSTEQHRQLPATERHIGRQDPAEVDQHDWQPSGAVGLNVHDTSPALIEEEEEGHFATNALVEQRSTATTPQDTDDRSEDNREERDMSYPGDYHYSRMASAQSERERTSSSTHRGPDTSRSSTSSGSSSNASTPCQGTEPARDTKKDDRSGSGGGGSGGAGASSSSSSGGSRSRLVAGVFVRY